MSELLPEEKLLWDLRRGPLRRLTEDVFLSRTILLTDQRLVIVKAGHGSNDKQVVSLADVSGVQTQRHYSLLLGFLGVLLVTNGVGGLFVSIVGLTSRPPTVDVMSFLYGAIFVVPGVLCFLNMNRKSLIISTTHEIISFSLDRSIESDPVDSFVASVQKTIAKGSTH